MYYQNYEEYIRSILGYPTYMGNNQYMNTYDNNNAYMYNMPTYNQNLLQLYPETYKILKPMVSKICEENTKPITEELIAQMTEEIYSNFENDNLNSEMNVTNVRVNVQRENATNRTTTNRNELQETTNRNGERRQNKNPILQDFIKTLILDKLLYDNARRRQYYQNNYLTQTAMAMARENERYFR